MGQRAFSLHKINGEVNAEFPFSVQEYQHYVFGDDKLAYRFGTELAKAYVAHGTMQSLSYTNSSSANVAVAVLSDQIPTATHSLRHHFIAYLNRHLISIGARPAIKIDIYPVQEHARAGSDPHSCIANAYHVDRMLISSRSVILLGDLRIRPDQELCIRESFRKLNLDNLIESVYLAQLDESTNPAILSPILSSIIAPRLKDIEDIIQTRKFIMNRSFVHYMLGLEFENFCQLLRRQDDSFVSLLMDYTICGGYYDNELYQQNFNFLSWELKVREDM